MGLDVTAYKQMELVETLGGIDKYEEKYDWPTAIQRISIPAI